jgi:signal transduction histidine kinase/ligand-binding sensor domain-containing protein
MKRIYLNLYLIFIVGTCASQVPTLFFHHLNVEKGLSRTPNLFVLKDSKGIVWVSSTNGVNQFNGQTVKVYLPDDKKQGSVLGDNVQGPFFEDSQSNIWFATFQGINGYKRKADNFYNFVLKNEEGKPAPLGYFTLGMDNKDRLWFLHRYHAVYVLDTHTGVCTKVQDVPENSRRGLLVPTMKGTAYMTLTYSLTVAGLEVNWFDENLNFRKKQTFLDSLHLKTKVSPINDAFQENDNSIWLSTTEGVIQLNPQTGAYQYTRFKGSRIKGIAPLPNNMVACATETDGLWFFDKAKQQFVGNLSHIPDMPHTLTADQLEGVETDTEGGLWVSVVGRGVDYASVEKNKFRQLSFLKEGIPTQKNNIWSALLEDSESKIWCTTSNNGIFVLDKTSTLVAHYGANELSPYMIPNTKIYHIFEDSQQRIWLMTHKGLFVKKRKNKEFRVVDTAEAYLFGLQLNDGRLLFSKFQGGIWEYLDNQNGKGQFVLCKGAIETSAWTVLFEDSKKHLWAGHDLKAVTIFKQHNKDFIPLSDVPIIGDLAGFSEDKQQAKMWLAVSPSLYSVREKDYKITDSLMTDLAIVSIKNDGKNGLWLGTNKGLQHFDLTTKKAQQYSLADGLNGLEMRVRSILQKKDGTFLFGCGNGIVSCGKDGVQPLKAKAFPYISAFTVNDTTPQYLRCSKTGVANPSEMQAIQLNYDENLLGFTLNALEYSDPNSCRIRYVLTGIDRDTVEIRSGTQIRYPNLSPGSYQFKVWAANSDGIWNLQAHELAINIRPAFWQTWWFKALALAAFVGIIYFYFHLRDLQRKRLQNLRNNLSRDLHDELGSTLSSISILSESAKNREAQPNNSLDQIGQRAREAMDSVSDMVWAIKPQNDPLTAVARRMRLFAAEILEPQDINIQFSMSDEVQNLQLLSEQRKEFYLIFKEAITNCAKYSQATTVDIRLEKKGKMLVLTIHDNGKGFDWEAVTTDNNRTLNGNGLRNMAVRAQTLKAQLSVETKPNEGTTIRLEVPILSK